MKLRVLVAGEADMANLALLLGLHHGFKRSARSHEQGVSSQRTFAQLYWRDKVD